MGKLGIKSDNYTSWCLIYQCLKKHLEDYTFILIFLYKNVDCRLLRYLKQLLILSPYFPTMQALARNNREGDGSAYAFFPSQFLQSPFLRCSHPKWTKTLDELITSFYKYMLFLGDSSTTFYVIIWKKLIYFTPIYWKPYAYLAHFWEKNTRFEICTIWWFFQYI